MKKFLNRRSNLRLFTAGVLLAASTASAAINTALLKENAKIAFLGDSITQQGARTNGYVTLTLEGLAANGIEPQAVKSGRSGHKSNDMLARLDRDILRHKPDIMTLSCGVNDVWHRTKGVPLEEYRDNIRAIVERALAAGCEVVILTSTMIREDPENNFNKSLTAYNDFLRELAREKDCVLADTGAAMVEHVKKQRAGGNLRNTLTTDGVHMNDEGNRLMAECLLRSLGLDESQMRNAYAAWERAK